MSTRSKVSAPNKSTATGGLALTNDQLKRKAKLQLMGSAVLVLVGVVIFAVLLDNPPRPNNTEVALLIPARDSIAPLASASAVPVMALSDASVSVAPASAASATPTASAPQQTASAATASLAATKPASVQASAPTPASKPASAPVPAKSQQTVATAASLDPKEVLVPTPAKAATPAASAPTASAASGRYVLQVGAYTDPQKLRDVRLKLERAGIKTYTQVVQNAEGQRTRVRVGPFATKAEADKVAAKVKALDLPTALLTL